MEFPEIPEELPDEIKSLLSRAKDHVITHKMEQNEKFADFTRMMMDMDQEIMEMIAGVLHSITSSGDHALEHANYMLGLFNGFFLARHPEKYGVGLEVDE